MVATTNFADEGTMTKLTRGLGQCRRSGGRMQHSFSKEDAQGHWCCGTVSRKKLQREMRKRCRREARQVVASGDSVAREMKAGGHACPARAGNQASWDQGAETRLSRTKRG